MVKPKLIFADNKRETVQVKDWGEGLEFFVTAKRKNAQQITDDR
jgi:hypothetical protein